MLSQVNTNGVLSFGTFFDDFTPESFPLSFIRPIALIAPYWDDHDVRAGGLILYRSIQDEFLLDLVGSNISTAFNISFSPTSLFVATWNEVGEYLGNPAYVRCYDCALIMH